MRSDDQIFIECRDFADNSKMMTLASVCVPDIRESLWHLSEVAFMQNEVQNDDLEHFWRKEEKTLQS